MINKIRFSIIIPVKEINSYIRETVVHVKALWGGGGDWELIILPNNRETDEWNDIRIRIEPSGKVGPAKKRDLGGILARGEYLVFLDDDSYPSTDLLDIANSYFKDQSLVALGGPAITPAGDDFWQRVSGAVFLSKWSGGNPERYAPVGASKEVDDWPSVNLMVRRSAFLEIGGFNSPYWPGEDTKFCLELKKATGKRILYVPTLVVWHHRRGGLRAHLKQIGAYGLHRGHFARFFPENSRRFKYFLPPIFSVFCILSIFVCFSSPELQYIFAIGWTLYLCALIRAFADIIKFESSAIALVALPYIFLTHFWYGLRFVVGFLKKDLVSELR